MTTEITEADEADNVLERADDIADDFEKKHGIELTSPQRDLFYGTGAVLAIMDKTLHTLEAAETALGDKDTDFQKTHDLSLLAVELLIGTCKRVVLDAHGK